MANSIQLMDMNGSDLLPKTEASISHDDKPNVDLERLFHEIRIHDVISFDVFDTLVMRKVLYPEDVFHIVMRKAGAMIAEDFDFIWERSAAGRDAACSLGQIYHLLCQRGGLAPENTDKLMMLEYSCDTQLIVAREQMREVYRYAKSLGKTIYLTTDTCYDSKQIGKLLRDNGYDGFEKVIASSEYGDTKMKSLFGALRQEIGGKSCLHIGDDLEADKRSEKFGIDPFLIMSAANMVSISRYKMLLSYDNQFEDRILIGLFTCRMFNNPFALACTDGRGKINSAFDLGYCFAAPIVSVFIQNLLEMLRGRKFANILFLARDGFISLKLYETAVNFLKWHCKDDADYPDPIYFYTSRVACVSASVSNIEDIYKQIKPGFDGSFDLLMKTRFLFDGKDSNEQLAYSDIGKYIAENQDAILTNAEALRSAYRKYAQSLGINSDKSYMIYDFVATGTCQLLLGKILSAEFEGCYFIRLPGASQEHSALKIRDLQQNDPSLSENMFANECYLLLESILCSPEPSLKCFNENGVPVFFEEDRTQQQLGDIKEAQRGILQYFDDYILLTGLRERLRGAVADKILSYIQSPFTDIGRMPLCDEAFLDTYMNRSLVLRPR
jgi:FMN phosphatase YigB (HAD superfamily)